MLIWACIAPHGGELIPELVPKRKLPRMALTRAGMEELGRRCRTASPETLVVYTPHGLAIEDHISISVTQGASGVLEGENGRSVAAQFEVDGALARALSDLAADAGVPMAQAAYLPDGQPAPLLPLDWGALVPLWFIADGSQPPPRVVVVCPARSLSRRQLIAFGWATAEAAHRCGRRIAIVCSADQGHGHAEDGPYGFSPVSASYDRAYCRAVSDNALQRLRYWREDWIEGALTDSFWQTLMLYGALQHTPLRPHLLTYEAPTYFGMACAAFEPEDRRPVYCRQRACT
jgi:aromatic ring-opening dioxygenase LigB subunit